MNGKEETAKIMIVEDSPTVALHIKNVLVKAGYDVCGIASSSEEAIRMISEERPDLVLMDVVLKGEKDGVHTAEHVSTHLDTPVVFLTNRSDDATLQRAKLAHAFGYLVKPVEETDLRTTIEISIYRHKMEKRLVENQVRLTLLNNVGSRILLDIPAEEIIGNCVAEIATEFKKFRVSFLFVKENGQVARAQENGLNRNLNLRILGSGQQLPLEYLDLLRAQGMIVEENTDLPDSTGSLWRTMLGATRAFLDAALMHSNQILGILCFDSPEPYQWREYERTTLSQIADLLTALLLRENAERERRSMQSRKDEIISLVAHELRGPLTAIHASLSWITQHSKGLPKKVVHLAEIADQSSERMMRLINDMLDIDKIESDKMVFQRQPLDLTSLVKHGMVSNQPYGEQYEVQFVLIKFVPEAKVFADSDALLQVLTNLLTNAAKFSSTGGTVEISIQRKGTALRVSVKDHGPGIPEEFRGKVFERFHQGPAPPSRTKGTGLGLTISKAIIERLDGQISFETETGIGTTFHFDLPEWNNKERDTIS